MVWVLAAAEEGGTFNPFDVQFGLIVWVTIAFVIVLYALAKKVFPKLEETLADREQRIREDLEKAEATRREADQILEEYRQRVSQAREEANSIIEQARQDADAVRRDLVTKSEGDAREILNRAQQQLGSERDRAIDELQRQLAVWSSEIAGRILQKELTAESHKELVDSFIRDIDRQGAK